MIDEVHAYATGPLIVQVSKQTERAEMTLEFLSEDRCALTAARVARFVGAKED